MGKMFFGRYNCKMENDTISIPWKDEKIFDMPFGYVVLESDRKRKRVCVYTDDSLEHIGENEMILEKDRCQFDKKGKWILPKSVLEVITEEECIWLGVGSMAELMAEKSMKDATSFTKEELDELKSMMSKIFNV